MTVAGTTGAGGEDLVFCLPDGSPLHPAKNSRKESILTWTSKEVHEFAQYLTDHPFYALWLLTASTGMRRSELLGLRWKDVDLDRGLVAIRQVLVKADGTARFKGAPKSQHGFRALRIPPRLVEGTRQAEGRARRGESERRRMARPRPRVLPARRHPLTAWLLKRGLDGSQPKLA